MIKVKLFEKKKDKNGETKREVKSEKEIKKKKDYKAFINELSKAFSIKNKFILMVLTEDDDEVPINNQEDLDSNFEEAKEFRIIIEEGSLKTKPTKKTKPKDSDSDDDDDKNGNDNNKDGGKKKGGEDGEEEEGEEEEEGDEEDFLKKINIKVNLELSDQEIETLMNSVKMPEIDNINDDPEFDIEKYKEDLNNKNNAKIEDFKKIFETNIKSIIEQKSTIIKNKISQLVSNTDQENNLKTIEEETNTVKQDFSEIVKNTSEMNMAIGDLKYRLTGKKSEFNEINFDGPKGLDVGAEDMILQEDEEAKNENENLMIKFEEKEIKQDISIKKSKFFEIENIKISNIGNKEFKNLFFEIDPKESSKDFLFYENTKNNTNHKLSLNGPLQKGENLNNIVTFYIKDPKIQEYTMLLYAREKANGENLSLPLKITVNLIEDPEEKKKKEEEEKKKKEEEEKKKKEEEDKKRMEEEEKKKKEEEEKKKKIPQPGRDGGDPGKKVNVIVDYKGLDEKEVKKMFDELNSEYNLASMFDEEEVLNKIVEYNLNREKMNKWIEDSL